MERFETRFHQAHFAHLCCFSAGAVAFTLLVVSALT